GSGTLDATGRATLAAPALTAGAHTISVAYAGDANFTASSATFTQVGNKAATTPTLRPVSPAPSVYAPPFFFPATGNLPAPGSAAATGTVHLREGTTELASTTLSGGMATLSTAVLTGGTHALTVVYDGDANVAGSTSATFGQTVNRAATTTGMLSPS